MRPNYVQRLTKIREHLGAQDIQAALIVQPANVRYLTGFRGEGYLVIGPEAVHVSTDGRYKQEAAEIANVAEAVFDENGHLAGALAVLREFSFSRVAFEAEYVTFAAYQQLQEKLASVAWIPLNKLVEQQRLIKDVDEITAIRVAAQRTDAALASFLQALRLGEKEQRLALALQAALADQELEPAFPIIMASGPSAARPHAVPTSRLFQKGDMLKIDVGGRDGHTGYCCDLTRTIYAGEPDAKFREIYRLVQEAQQAAIEAARPGLRGCELDAVARQIISAAGYGEYFSHGLGHGVGLQVHEGPRISAKSEEVLQAGMIITIEPGIYLSGWGGVRIEDTVLITENACEVLTKSPKADY